MNEQWTVVILRKADKQLHAIPERQRERIRAAINKLSAGPYDSDLDVEPLQGRPEWRLRVGGWRVLFRVDGTRVTITVVKVGPRGDVYK